MYQTCGDGIDSASTSATQNALGGLYLYFRRKKHPFMSTVKGTAYHWQIKQTSKQFLHQIRESVIIRTYTTRTKIACIKMLRNRTAEDTVGYGLMVGHGKKYSN